MRIDYGDTTLGDDAAGNCIVVEGSNHKRKVDQEDDMFRAQFAATFDRDNARNDFTFTVDIEHKDDEKALLYMLTHRDSLPGQARLRWKISTTIVLQTDATFLSAEMVSFEGRSTKFRYHFTGGQFTRY